MRRATAMPARRAAYHDKSEPVQNRVFRSLKVGPCMLTWRRASGPLRWDVFKHTYSNLVTHWSILTTQSTKAVYNRIIDLKIATPHIIINYGLFLEEQNYFEEAFKVRLQHSLYSSSANSRLIPHKKCFSVQAYERGVSLFKWPHVYDIWNTYLTKFIKRYVSYCILPLSTVH